MSARSKLVWTALFLSLAIVSLWVYSWVNPVFPHKEAREYVLIGKIISETRGPGSECPVLNESSLHTVIISIPDGEHEKRVSFFAVIEEAPEARPDSIVAFRYHRVEDVFGRNIGQMACPFIPVYAKIIPLSPVSRVI